MNGFFVIPMSKTLIGTERIALCIVSSGVEQVPWEHVSARISEGRGNSWHERTPTWEEMCVLKDLFWKDDEVVIQLHPAKENYVNLHPNVLHLWRPWNAEIPLPPLAAV